MNCRGGFCDLSVPGGLGDPSAPGGLNQGPYACNVRVYNNYFSKGG